MAWCSPHIAGRWFRQHPVKLGEDPARANTAKLACNMMIAMAIEAMAEAVVLTDGVGLDRADFFELILGTLFSGRAYESYSAQITERSFEPGFKAKLALKDMRLATEAGNDLGHMLPMLEIVRERLGQAVGDGHGEKDWSIMTEIAVRGDRKPATPDNRSESEQ
jgi:3-hydroxyisobutyrate dehydrogenase-like beta-hydroxyacid dehydrogenase